MEPNSEEPSHKSLWTPRRAEVSSAAVEALEHKQGSSVSDFAGPTTAQGAQPLAKIASGGVGGPT
eukprot:121624-Alexandrium_andersonii.AAC.1